MSDVREGHRERIRERYKNHGSVVFTDTELLELLLTYCIPRRDTSEAAHLLMKKFKTLSALLNAGQNALCETEGIGEGSAEFLRLIGTIYARSELSRLQDDHQKTVLSSPERTKEYVRLLFAQAEQECLFLICLDAKGAVISAEQLGRGTVSEVYIHPRMIAERALKNSAHSVILCHNHPTGDVTPSPEDLSATESALSALNSLEISLRDHLIVGRDAVYSFSAGRVL